MSGKEKTNGSLAMAPRVITIPAASQENTRKLRVAAYARVSSNSEDQKHSFAAQNAYFSKLITDNPDWELADIYADQGITGTSMELAVLTLVSVEMEEYEAHRLRSIFGKQAKMRELDANLLRQSVRKITYGSKTVKVLLKNNQVLEECDDA